MLPRLTPQRAAAYLLRSVVAGEIGRQLGVLFECPAGADGTFQNDARRSHGRRDDVRICARLSHPSMTRSMSRLLTMTFTTAAEVMRAERASMPIRHGGRLVSRASTWPRDHFCRSTIAPRRSCPTTWNEFLPISMSITAMGQLDC